MALGDDGHGTRRAVDEPLGGAPGHDAADPSPLTRPEHEQARLEFLDRAREAARRARVLDDMERGRDLLGAQLAAQRLEGVIRPGVGHAVELAAGQAVQDRTAGVHGDDGERRAGEAGGGDGELDRTAVGGLRAVGDDDGRAHARSIPGCAPAWVIRMG